MPVHVVGRTQSPHPLGNQKRWPVQIKSDVGGANGYDEDELARREIIKIIIIIKKKESVGSATIFVFKALCDMVWRQRCGAALFCGGPLNSNKSISSSRDKRDRRRRFQNS